MHNNYGLHELLYTGEHYTCNNYLSDIGIGFVYKEFDEGSQLHRNCFMQYNHLIFIIEGNCTVSCNQFTGRHFKSGEMVLIPRSSAFRGQADSPMKIIDMAFEVPINGCDRLILHNYFPLCQNMKYDFVPLEIRYPLSAYIDLLAYCLQSGINCVHFHEIKHKELFFYLRCFYTKEEVASLFYPIIGNSINFRNLVYDLLPKASSVDAMVALSGMSRNAFLRKFKEEFHETAYKWLMHQICQRIIGDIADTELSIKEIMMKYDFYSHSNFNRFCKENFGCSPTRLVETYRKIRQNENK